MTLKVLHIYFVEVYNCLEMDRRMDGQIGEVELEQSSASQDARLRKSSANR